MELCGTNKIHKALLGQCSKNLVQYPPPNKIITADLTYTSKLQELSDMGLTASMRRSLRRVGNGDSSQLDLGLSQSTSLSYNNG